MVERFFINQSNNRKVIIGGVRSLEHFSPEQVVVRVGGACITVIGDGFKLARFDENEIAVLGKIKNVLTDRKI